MIEIIKKTALGAVENTNPMIMQFGTVMSMEPFEVLVEQKITVGEQQIIALWRHDEIEEGHRLVLLRMQGGQRYYILEDLDAEEEECACCECEEEEE